MNKIYFQGTFGAYSHLAALSIDPKANVLIVYDEASTLPLTYTSPEADKVPDTIKEDDSFWNVVIGSCKFKDELIKSEKSSPLGMSLFSNFPTKYSLFLLAIVY